MVWPGIYGPVLDAVAGGQYFMTKVLPTCDTENTPLKAGVKLVVKIVNLEELNPVMLAAVRKVQLYDEVLLNPAGFPVRSIV